MAVRFFLSLTFLALALPSNAKAMDLFEFFDRVLGNSGPIVASEHTPSDNQNDPVGPNSILLGADGKPIYPKPVVQPPPEITVGEPVPLPGPISQPSQPTSPSSIDIKANANVGAKVGVGPMGVKVEAGASARLGLNLDLPNPFGLNKPKPQVVYPLWDEKTKKYWQQEVSSARKAVGINGDEQLLNKKPEVVRPLEDRQTFLVPLKYNREPFLVWRFEPFIYFNLDYTKKTTNLMPYTLNPLPSAKIPLQPASWSGHGYFLNISKELGVGAGAAVYTTGVFGGVMGAITEVKAVSRYATHSEAKIVGGNEVYENPTPRNIKLWKIGESNKYTLRKDFVIAGGGQFIAISGGIYNIKEGTAQHVVTKIRESRILVQIIDIEAHIVDAKANLAIVGGSDSIKRDVKRLEKTLLYDLTDEIAANAYVELMNGNYAVTQDIIVNRRTPAVTMVQIDESTTYLDKIAKDYYRSSFFGLPFFFWSWLDGNTTEDGLAQKYIDKLESKYYHGFYFDNANRRLGFDHQNLLSAFYTGIEKVKIIGGDGKEVQDYYGRYFWNYQDESTEKSDLRTELNKLIYVQTGLEELDVDESQVAENLNYVNAEVIMELDQEMVQLLMFDVVESGASGLKDSLKIVLQDYLKKDYPEQIDYCVLQSNSLKSKIVKMFKGQKSKEACVQQIREQTTETLDKMQRLLQSMWENVRASSGNAKIEFAQRFREFGQHMMTNRFTFRTVYNFLAANSNRDFIRYTINGERLANMVLTFPSGKVGKPETMADKTSETTIEQR